MSSGYHEIITQNICMSVWQVQIQRLPFGAAPRGDMVQQEIDKIFKNLPNIFGIADDILVVGYDPNGKRSGRNAATGVKNMQTGELKKLKDKCHFRCKSVPFFGEMTSSMKCNPTHKC